MTKSKAAAAFVLLFLLSACGAIADDLAAIQSALDKRLLAPDKPLEIVRDFIDARVARIPKFSNQTEWNAYARSLRAKVLNEIIFRGEAAAWRDARCQVQWLDSIPGGPGYRIRKLRYEALPGWWIPALLYEPDKLAAPQPAVLNLSGHEAAGKAVDYKQIRCINLAKRGMLALHPEWIGMGQLADRGYAHGRMNQLDLCGSSGLAVFYLAMRRGLDLLACDPRVDPTRIAVTGLSGGGWQTGLLAAFDQRVALANPVAGYTSLRIAIRHHDMGDSEQAPSDLAAVADGAVWAALRAPLPTLLTYNAGDECCFKADHTLQPLLDAAKPVFALIAAKDRLRWHVNYDPGTHNYDRDNRQVFYGLVDDYFFPRSAPAFGSEIECTAELKSAAELDVPLPADNLNFPGLAGRLSNALPRDAEVPTDKALLGDWQTKNRARLRALLRIANDQAQVLGAAAETAGETHIKNLLAQIGPWQVPVALFNRGEAIDRLVICIADAGRCSQTARIKTFLDAGWQVAAVDPLLIGQSQISGSDPQAYFALAIESVGQRCLGIQAGQLAALARHFATAGTKVSLFADGRRSSLAVLVAAALEPEAISGLQCRNSLASLKQLIEEDRAVEEFPELFPFGLLAEFDIAQVAALAAPRPLEFSLPDANDCRRLARLIKVYETFGQPSVLKFE